MAKQMKYGRYLHGGDYNPEQWLDRPDILQKDIEYFKKAHINTVSVGIFFPGQYWNQKKENITLPGWKRLLTIFTKRGILYHPCNSVRSKTKMDGRQIRRSPSYGPGQNKKIFGGRHNHCYTLRYTEKKSMRSIRN